jgi:hypothetical protein
MTDELVKVSGKSGPHVVWRPGTNGELVVAGPCGGLRSKYPIKMSRGGSPQAIGSESSAEKHFAVSRNDDARSSRFRVGTLRSKCPQFPVMTI